MVWEEMVPKVRVVCDFPLSKQTELIYFVL